MTKKLFWTDPYRQKLVTQVASVDGAWLTLDETIFYAFSGGQESDQGSIGEFPVLDACCRGRDVRYRLTEEHSLTVGDQVEVSINWDRRYRLMRLHFAAELVLELVYRELTGIKKVGAHISADKARLDFDWPENISYILPRLLSQTEALIAADLPITSAYSNLEQQQRFWQVDGFARVPCGGTHLERTGEVGRIALRRVNPGKGKERIALMLETDYRCEKKMA